MTDTKTTTTTDEVVYEHPPEVLAHRIGCPANRLEPMRVTNSAGHVLQKTRCNDCGRESIVREPNPELEQLVALRETDVVAYHRLPVDVRQRVDTYVATASSNA